MKNIFTSLFISIAFIIAGCSSEQQEHSHGEGADHTHETPAQQSTGGESDAVRIGSGEHSDEESDHSHDEESDHSHEEEHSHDEDNDHSHEEENSHDDSTHSHGDEDHSH